MPTDHVWARPIWMSGAKAVRSLFRPVCIAIGKVGLSGNEALYSRLVWLSNTGHASPGSTRPEPAFRVNEWVGPGLAPNTPVKSDMPRRSYATCHPALMVA